MMNRLATLAGMIDSDFPDHLKRVKTFLRQPSISGENCGMAEMAQLVADDLEGLGAQVEIVPTSGYPVVYGKIDAGAPKTLLLYGMYDVQPADEPDWIVPPFEGAVVSMPGLGECIVSRGATNSKGPLAGFFNVIRTYRAAGLPLPVNLMVIVEGEEELGSRHLPEFINQYEDTLRKAHVALFPAFRQDLTGIPIMQLGTKGLLYMELTCRGGDWGGPVTHGIHGSYAAWIDSPVWRLIQALSSLLHEDGSIAIKGFYDDVRSPTAQDVEVLRDLANKIEPAAFLEENKVKRFKYDLETIPLLEKFLFSPTLNIDGIISGYTGSGTKTLLPHEAKVKLDIRMIPDMEPEKVVELLRSHFVSRGYGDIEIAVLNSYPWSKVSVNSQPAQAMLRTYRHFGYEPQIWPMNPGSAPLYLFNERLGIPYVLGGLGHGERAHGPNELATVEGLRMFEKSMAAFLEFLVD